jgi:hypothetical protein
MVSPLIVVSINPPKHTRGLDALSIVFSALFGAKPETYVPSNKKH